MTFSFIVFQVAQYNVYSTYVYTIFPAIFAFYLGAWADLFGRKILIYMGITSSIIKIGLTIICAYFMDSSKYYLLATEVPVSLTGGFFGWMIAINAFLSDITSKKWNNIHGLLRLVYSQKHHIFKKCLRTACGHAKRFNSGECFAPNGTEKPNLW